MRAMTTILQCFRIVGVLQDVTYNQNMSAAKNYFYVLWGKEINSSVGDEKVISSAGKKMFGVPLEKHRFKTLSAPTE